ncbi:MAG: LytTR family DNA-binding domain-containing protein [Candidatus Spyradocola sp.]|jgi:DNA-binding LytR/AlgR family response regulator
MKLTYEPAAGEVEVVVRGTLGDPEVPRILAALQMVGSMQSRLLLRRVGTERDYLLEPDKVDYFAAREGRVFARAGGVEYESKLRLYELEEMLRAHGFLQISKSIVVNLHAVRAVEAEFSGNYTALLRDEKTKLTISRSYMRAFRKSILEGT